MSKHDLQEAFALFSKETARLEKSYYTLREEYQKLYEKLESIVTHISEGLIFVTVEGRLSIFNRAAAGLMDLSQQKTLGKSYWDIFPDTFFGFSMREGLKQSKRSLLSLSYNDQELEVSTSFVPEKGLLLLLRDVTDLRRLEKAVDRNDRLRELGEMAASLAHEIRNPLGGIEGFASLLLRELKEEPKQREMAHSIIDGTRVLNRLVCNVLHFARPLEIHFTPANLVSIVEEIVDLVEADESEKGSCSFQTSQPSISVSLDHALIKMALLNVVRNGLQASSKKGEVTIKVWTTKETAHIAIADQGRGISPKTLEKIFTPFFTTKCSGTGLGLSETEKIIKAHGGTIEVDSKVNKGSTFTIKLPLENEN